MPFTLDRPIEPIDEVVPELPDRYEVIDGDIVEKPAMGVYSALIANRLRDHLSQFGFTSQSGFAVMDMLFSIPTDGDLDKQRRTDAAFLTYQRWPKSKPVPFEGNPAEVVPNLVVEVVSPHDKADDIVEKLNDYLRAGVEMVWIVWPKDRNIYSYTSPKSVRIFTAEDTLDGGELLPGFSIAMADLFPTRG